MTWKLWLLAAGILTASIARAADAGDKSKSFPAHKNGSLEVSLRGGGIRITPWDKDEVVIEADGGDEESFSRLNISQKDNTITLNDRSSWGDSWSSDLTVKVPSQFNLDIQTSEGNIEINGPLSGTLKGATSAGDIYLGNLGGSIEMSTSGGDIQSGDIKGKLQLHTAGGDIHIGTISDNTEVFTSGGDLSIEGTGRNLVARTSGGEVRIGDVGGDADVSTAGGNIVVGKVAGNTSLNTGGGDIRLAGASGSVNVRTGGGNMMLNSVSGSVNAKTGGGDIDLQLIPQGKGLTTLSTSAGNIRLYVPENARATINARVRARGFWRNHRDEFSIRSDFNAESYEKGEHGGDIRATYVLNGGGDTITLETMMGDIEIRNAKSWKPEKEK
jgi:DUF4097 and DUF4098 domain-containing protein YvlB